MVAMLPKLFGQRQSDRCRYGRERFRDAMSYRVCSTRRLAGGSRNQRYCSRLHGRLWRLRGGREKAWRRNATAGNPDPTYRAAKALAGSALVARCNVQSAHVEFVRGGTNVWRGTWYIPVMSFGIVGEAQAFAAGQWLRVRGGRWRSRRLLLGLGLAFLFFFNFFGLAPEDGARS